MPDRIPVTVAAGDRSTTVTLSPARLYEQYKLMILAGKGSNAPKIRRAMEYVAYAREQNTFTADEADRLDQLAATALWETEHPEERTEDDDDW